MACFIPREFVPVAMFMLYLVVVVSLSLVVVLWFPSVSHPPFFFYFFFQYVPHFIRAPQRVAGSKKKSTFGKSSLPRAKLAL